MYDDFDSFQRAMTSPAGQELLKDDAKLIAVKRLFFANAGVEQLVVVGGGCATPQASSLWNSFFPLNRVRARKAGGGDSFFPPPAVFR